MSTFSLQRPRQLLNCIKGTVTLSLPDSDSSFPKLKKREAEAAQGLLNGIYFFHANLQFVLANDLHLHLNE
jgi:hypothetical protein